LRTREVEDPHGELKAMRILASLHEGKLKQRHRAPALVI
jgi:hypothetical protein